MHQPDQVIKTAKTIPKSLAESDEVQVYPMEDHDA
jgi:hypothetical protein